MITNSMTLKTKTDATVWADSLLDGYDGYQDIYKKNVSEYLWNNFRGQDWETVQSQLPIEEKWWDIVESNQKEVTK